VKYAAALLLAAAGQLLIAEPLDAILAHMDRAAKDFKSVSAKTRDDEWVAVIDETNTQNGQMVMKRTKKGVVGLIKFGAPDPRVFHIDGSKLEAYYPNANTLNVYDAGKNTQVVNQFVLLGFGTSGSELSKEYTIKVVGAEKVGSVNTTHLELLPRSPEMQKYISKLELWIADGETNPRQEKLTYPSKNYSFYHFSDVQVNPSLPESAFELKLPKNVKVITPQK
jgi:outer membrane lipoprotein-sorting protein